jgi:hypothetical protein
VDFQIPGILFRLGSVQIADGVIVNQQAILAICQFSDYHCRDSLFPEFLTKTISFFCGNPQAAV